MTLTRLIQSLAALCLLISPAIAQQPGQTGGAAPEYGWKTDVTAALNLTQASFSNWAQGGEDAIAWQTSLNANSTLERPKFDWAIRGKLAYGLSRVGDQDTRKSADEIKFETVYTYKMGTVVNPFASATAETQFTAGYQYADDGTRTQVSQFLDPGYFTQSIGVGYTRGNAFKTRLGATLKETVTRDFPVPYADDPDTPGIEKTRIEGGITSTTDFSYKLSQNLLYDTHLVVFSNLQAFNEIDVTLETLLTAKVAKYLNTTFALDLVYDRTVTDELQLKQVLALSLTYSLF